MTKVLDIGDRAPDFELKGNDGEMYKLSDYRGQPVVLLFYPLDFSNTCTKEHAAACDNLPAMTKSDAMVFGISVDSWWTHKAFAEAADITYPLLADFHPKGAVGRMYGVYNSDLGSHNRWTFVIDLDGRVAHIQTNERGEVPDMEEIVEAVKETLD
jgi:peroxiredoxin (alkyl hydroperoxide reductase subunit C)